MIAAVALALAIAAAAPPDEPSSSASLAEAYRAARRLPEAIREYEKLVSARPHAAPLRARLAELYGWTGDYDRAIVSYRSALEDAPDDPHVSCGLARVLRWARRYSEAEAIYHDVLARDPRQLDALEGLARTLSLEGDRVAALALIDRALRDHPESAALHEQRGIVLGWDRRYEDAERALATASRLAPDDSGIWRSRGDVYRWMKRDAEALRAYERATAIQPENAQNHVAMAQAYLALRKRALASEQVQIALRLAPFDGEARQLAASIDGQGALLDARTLASGAELGGYAFVFALVTLTARRRRRMLQRRHRGYLIFARYVIPPFAVIAAAVHVGHGAVAPWIAPELLWGISQAVLLVGIGIAFVTLLWTENTRAELGREVVLAIGAHPDDIELGCGGYIMKAKASGARVYGLTLSRGERGAPPGRSRVLEAHEAARYMRLDGYWVLDFPDTRLQECITRLKEAIEAKIVEVGATTVLTHTDLDVHGDHRAVHAATREAARDVPAVLSYEDVSTPNEFVPNLYVDITEYVEDELRIVGFHRSQAHREYMTPEAIKGRAAHRGLQSGVAYAEAFRADRIIH